MNDQQLENTLEKLQDATNLQSVLRALSNVQDRKATRLIGKNSDRGVWYQRQAIAIEIIAGQSEQ